MKYKGKSILGVALTLMLMVTMLAWTAPVSAGNTLQWDDEDIPEELKTVDITDIAVGGDGAVIYAATGFAKLGAWDAKYGTATWDDTEQVSGDYSAKIHHLETGGQGMVYVEFTPQPGITVADLADIVSGDWEFEYFLTSGWGPQLELKFTDPDPESDGLVEITVEPCQTTPILNNWDTAEVGAKTPALYYGNAPGGTALTVTPGVLMDLDQILGVINDDAVMLAGPDTADDWELTRVRVALWDANTADRDCYIDDVTIDGTTYAMEPGELYVSTDTGESWEDTTVIVDSGILSVDFVAVSPDDPAFIAVAGDISSDVDKTGVVYISDDGGATWDTLGQVDEFGDKDLVIHDIAVSVEGSDHFLAVAGEGTDDAEVYYYEMGAIRAEWTEIGVDYINVGVTSGWEDADVARAVAFSPNFLSDELLAVVTFDAANGLKFQVFTFNQDSWNIEVSGFDGDYPVDLDVGDANPTSLDSASIAMSPEYLGSDDDLRQVFVGLATDQDDSSGIFLVEDDSVDALEDGELIRSVDFDGTNLVAGSFDGTTVFRSDDPLKGEDADVDSSSAKKSPGGEFRTVVAFADDAVVAGTSGDESSFSVSTNNGKTFNDISLIDTSLDEVLDVAVVADGSMIYLLTADGTGTADMSLWRLADDVWERVLSRPDETNANKFIVRIAPDDADVIYLANAGGAETDTNLYYSNDGGETRWNNRTSKEPIRDLAVETDGSVAYVLTNNGYVSRSENSGFTWGGKETTGQAGSNMIVSLGEDLVLVGGVKYVSYSTDGNESWTDLDDLDDAGDVQVTASGLADGDFIYAATTGGGAIYRWEIGDGEWDDFYDEVDTAVKHATTEEYLDLKFTGIGLAEGTLYAVAFDETENQEQSVLFRFIDPTDGDVSIEAESLEGVLLSNTPSALRVSAGSAVLWAIGVDTTDDAQKLYSYEDTIATVAPTLKGPKDGFTVPINEISGEPADVNFSWECPSDEITGFDLKVALDDEFGEVVFDSGDFAAAPKYIDEDGDEGDLISFVMDDQDYALMPDVTYYWRVRVNEATPVESPWSDTWSFTVAEAEAAPPVTLEIPPAPEITVEMPAPEVTVTVPPMVQVPPAPAPTAPGVLWAVVIIGALLVIALIVLILRTRRVV